MVLPRCCICVSLLLMATSCPRKVEAAEKTSMFDSLLMQWDSMIVKYKSCGGINNVIQFFSFWPYIVVSTTVCLHCIHSQLTWNKQTHFYVWSDQRKIKVCLQRHERSHQQQLPNNYNQLNSWLNGWITITFPPQTSKIDQRLH